MQLKFDAKVLLFLIYAIFSFNKNAILFHFFVILHIFLT